MRPSPGGLQACRRAVRALGFDPGGSEPFRPGMGLLGASWGEARSLAPRAWQRGRTPVPQLLGEQVPPGRDTRTPPATRLPSQLLSLTLMCGLDPGQQGQDTQDQGHLRDPASRAGQLLLSCVPEGGGLARQWGCVHPTRNQWSPHPASFPLPQQGPEEQLDKDTHLLLTTWWGWGVGGGVRWRPCPRGVGVSRCQPGLSCDRYSGQAGWVTGQWVACKDISTLRPKGWHPHWLPYPPNPSGPLVDPTPIPGPPIHTDRRESSPVQGEVRTKLGDTGSTRELAPPVLLGHLAQPPGDLRSSGSPSTAPVPPSLLGHTRE